MTDETYVLSERIDTTGGPLIVMPSALLGEWFGSFDAPTPREATFRFSNPNNPATDYDRACDVNNYLGVISVGEGSGLVLGNELNPTYVATVEGGHIVIVRPLFGNDDSIRDAVARSFGDDFEERIDSYKPFSSAHMLFDSSYSGEYFLEDENSVSINFELPATDYLIDTHVYKPNKDVYIITHRFIPVTP